MGEWETDIGDHVGAGLTGLYVRKLFIRQQYN